MLAARGLRYLILLCGLLPTLLLQPANAKERVFWLVRDLPPFTIFEGAEQGQGVIDQLLPLLIRQMPEYDHSIVRVNRARGIQMLQDRNSFTCDPTLLWTPERAEYVRFSMPSLGVLSGGLVLRKESQALVAPYLDGQEVDLHGLLSKAALKLGVVAERSYGTQIDAILRQLPDTVLSRHYGNDATANLLQMQQLGRLRMVLGYWPEVRYLIQQQGGSQADYQFHSVQGVKRYQFFHVGCSDNELGRAAVAHIDRLLPALRRDVLPGLYARWLDPALREDYLEESKVFFEEH
ncbi:TIGR02285 family protein [Pseudomonas asiatica]|uniref:TIGR02285 family protein n=1 Tax=Pseudomonas asiatica TaxID=2219225 RepID=UPI002DBE6DB9|nr:TIGR02285 family protein [Pseudomonas asiatica]MEB6591585.1 TIGR02285 family protein [Pseudomonas asiatica]